MLDFEILKKTTRGKDIPFPVLFSPSISDTRVEGELYDEHVINDMSALNDVEQGELPLAPQVRKSTRIHHLSTRNSSSEHVTITEEDALKSFQDVQNHKGKT